jgi:hypothetical protein
MHSPIEKFMYQRLLDLAMIKILAYAKIQTIVMAFAGIIAGLIYSVGGLIYDLIKTGGVNKGTALAFFALPVMPIYFAVFGFITGVIGAFLYNSTQKLSFFPKWFTRIDIKK